MKFPVSSLTLLFLSAVSFDTIVASNSISFLGDEYPFIAGESKENRSPCPALNVIANYGLIPRDGMEVSLDEAGEALSLVFGIELNSVMAAVIGAVQNNNMITINATHFNLFDTYGHNRAEHDASLFNPDNYFEENADFSEELFEELFDMVEDKNMATRAEIIAFRQQRILHSRMNNPEVQLPRKWLF